MNTPHPPRNLEAESQLARRLGVHALEECRRFPKFFEIETVNACNARCIMCTIDDWNAGRARRMSQALFDRLVAEVSGHADWIEQICLNRDGEPTLDKGLADKVRALKQAGIRRVAIVTNGQLLDRDMAQALLEAGLDDVMFSVDGASKAVFERIRRRLDFDTVVGNVLDYIGLRDRIRPEATVRVRFIDMPENRHEIAAWRAFWEPRVGANDKVYVMPMHSWGNQLAGEDEDKVRAYASRPCISVFSSLALHVDGTAGICAVDYAPKYPAGDFRVHGIAEIWQGEAFTRFRELHLSGRRNEIDLCRGCDIWDRQYQGKYR